MSSMIYKIDHFLQERKDDISFVVVSNPIIRNSSFVIKSVKIDGLNFLRYNSWLESIKKNVKVQGTMKKEDNNVEIIANGYSFKMIFVKGGSFLMGATSEQGYGSGVSNAKPVHPVTLSDFYICETQVTQGLWKAVMGGLTFVHIHGVGDNLPVDCVEWDECQEFIFKLNILTGKKFRLPTEAEWEYAARGGNKSKGFKYAGSNNLSEVAWFGESVNSKVHPVAIKKANELGLYDMSGNVEEFCQDWYGEYTTFPTNNPKGPSSKSSYCYHVYRGGCNSSEEWQCRVSSRGFSAYGDSAGIRIVLDS